MGNTMPVSQAHLRLLGFQSISVSVQSIACLGGPQGTWERKKSAHSMLYKEDKTDLFHLAFCRALLCQVKSGNEFAPTAEYQMLDS